ncbi:MAG: hypothetical protein WD737_06335 [Gemmatimonadota bacterium]
MTEPYIPISCSIHDELLAAATLRRMAEIVYRSDTGDKVTARAKIEDVFARAGAEFLRLGDGSRIRLDRLLTVDGKLVTPAD